MKQMTPRYFWDLVVTLTQKELQVRYKNLAFGYLWSLASPLAFAMVYFVVFQLILKIPQPNYPLFLVVGLFPWQWIANSIGIAPSTFVSNAPLIKKTIFPRFMIPFVVVLQDLIHFVFTLPIILLFVFYFDHFPSLHWLYGIPLLVVAQFTLVYALNLIISSLTLFFRDLERIVTILLSFAFYLTPVLYAESMVPQQYQHLIPLNPLAPLMISWRSLLFDGVFDWVNYGISLAWGVAFLSLATWTYRRLVWRFAELM